MPRDSNGNYALPAGNPVVTATTISSTWANTTLSDLATAMTDSLDRSGNGAMLASLQLFNGVIGTPGLNWGSETTSGLYRAGAGDFRYAIGGVDKFQLTVNSIRGPDGVFTSPAFSFINDPNTGMYSVTADHLGFICGGVVQMEIASTFLSLNTTIQLQPGDGSLATPIYSFNADIDTGMYRGGANVLSFSCGAKLYANFNGTGNTVSLGFNNATGWFLSIPTISTVGAAGGASALPATPLGYIQLSLNGVPAKVPYYNI